MRVLLFPAILLLAACGQSDSKKKKGSSAKDTTVSNHDTVSPRPNEPSTSPGFPGEATVNTSLEARSNGQWHVLNDKEASWMKDAFDYFIVPKRKTEPYYPYLAFGDYNADGKEDTAAVVVDSLKTNYQVAVLMGDGKTIFWEEDIMADAALSTVPRSEVLGMDGEKTKKVRMKGDGINVEYFERAAFVLYWDKNSFKRIQTGD